MAATFTNRKLTCSLQNGSLRRFHQIIKTFPEVQQTTKLQKINAKIVEINMNIQEIQTRLVNVKTTESKPGELDLKINQVAVDRANLTRAIDDYKHEYGEFPNDLKQTMSRTEEELRNIERKIHHINKMRSSLKEKGAAIESYHKAWIERANTDWFYTNESIRFFQMRHQLSVATPDDDEQERFRMAVKVVKSAYSEACDPQA